MALLDVLNSLTGPTLVLGFLIEAFGVSVYAVEFWLILRNRAQRLTPFYALFMFRAMLAMLYLYSVNLFIRLPALNLFLEAYKQAPNGLYLVGWLINPLGIYGEYLANLAMVANRYTAIAHPLLHNKIWTMRNMLGCIACIVLFAVPWGVPNLTANSKGCVYPGNGSFVVFRCPLPPEIPNPATAFTNYNALFSACFLVAGAALNGATWHAFKRGPMGQSNGSESAKLECKLAKYTLISTVGYALQAVYYIGVWLLSQQGVFGAPLVAVVTLFLPLNADALCLALPAVLLLWASGELRRDLGLAVLGSNSHSSSLTPAKRFIHTSAVCAAAHNSRRAQTTRLGIDSFSQFANFPPNIS